MRKPQSNDSLNRSAIELVFHRQLESIGVACARPVNSSVRCLSLMKILYINLSMTILLGIAIQLAYSQNVDERDLSLYEKAGRYDLKLSLSDEAQNQMGAEIRDFLWRHWKEQRRGYLSANVYTMEGDPRTVNLYIEPDGKNHWNIVAEYVGIDYPPKGVKERPKRWKDTEVYRIIERYKMDEHSNLTRNRIAEEEEISSDKYLLLLKESPTANERIW